MAAQGMSKEEYQEWKSSLLTRHFHRYLMDYRQMLMDRWARGNLPPDSPDSLMAVARCQMAEELASLDDDAISDFYRNNQIKEGVS